MKHIQLFEQFINESVVNSLEDAIEKEMYLNNSRFETNFPTRELRMIQNTEDKAELTGSAAKVYKRLLKKYKLNEAKFAQKEVGVEESIDESNTTINIPNLSDIDHTRIIKWMSNQFDGHSWDMKKSGKGFEIDIKKLSKREQEDLMNYLDYIINR
jgi:hypothetical protein